MEDGRGEKKERVIKWDGGGVVEKNGWGREVWKKAESVVINDLLLKQGVGKGREGATLIEISIEI